MLFSQATFSVPVRSHGLLQLCLRYVCFYGRLIRGVKIIFKFDTRKYDVNPDSLDV